MSVGKWLRRPSFAAIATVMVMAQFASAQTYTVLHSFTGGSDGSRPQSGLTLLGSSNLFGSAGDYVLFRLRQTGPSWIFNPIFQFNGTNGQIPEGRLTLARAERCLARAAPAACRSVSTAEVAA